MNNTFLDKKYTWEDLYDVERDVYESIQDGLEENGLPGEFDGIIRITITYEAHHE